MQNKIVELKAAERLRRRQRGHSAFLCALLMLAGCSRAAAWNTFHDATAGFSADFPGQVTRPQGIEKSGTGAPATYHFQCSAPSGLTYEVVFTAQHNSAQEITSRLDSLEKQKIEPDSRYTSMTTNHVSAGAAAGIEQIYLKQSKQYGNSFMRVRTFLTAAGDYLLTVDSATTADADSPDVLRFLNSFKLDAAK